jgi:ankyrin repeat protein
MLLDIGVDIYIYTNKYSNTLQEAALLGKEEVVKILLGASVDVNVQGSKYSNALQVAA